MAPVIRRATNVGDELVRRTLKRESSLPNV